MAKRCAFLLAGLMLASSAVGCCCGITERGYAPVPTDLYHNEWERRRLTASRRAAPARRAQHDEVDRHRAATR